MTHSAPSPTASLPPSSLPTSLNEIALPEQLPPLMLTAFTRPDLLEYVLKGLSQQTLLPSKIIAFVDGARDSRDQPAIDQCIALLQDFSTTIPVDLKVRGKNLGCDRNMILAFTEVLSSHDSVICLEDDNVPNPHFYDRMCRLLEAYRGHNKVFSVSAYASFPEKVQPQISTDFAVSNRVYSWGIGTWADRWNAIDLANQPKQYNPFGSFYKIPANLQTKMTMTNQFWLEKNNQTDWVISMTLGALGQGQVNILSKQSLVENIGFGHPESKTYSEQTAQPWVNSRYDADANPESLPQSLDLPESLQPQLNGLELAQHFAKAGMWLNPKAMGYLVRNHPDIKSVVALVKLFFERLPMMLRRSRQGLPI